MHRTVSRFGWRAALAPLLMAWAAEPASADTANQLFVERAYHDLLGHVPDQSGLDAFAGALDHGSETDQQVAEFITGSDEFHSLEVQQAYQNLLHHSADSLSLNAWVNQLRSAMTVEQLESNLAGSPEYYTNRGGGTNNGFLTALYPDLLGRPISSTERTNGNAALSGGESRTALASSLDTTAEYDQRAVSGWYVQFLHRAADPTGRSVFVNEMQIGTRDEQVISQLVGGSEYYSLPLLPGDANFDQSVGFDDLLTVAQNYGLSNAHWFNGDFNGDNKVDFNDLLLLAQNYGRTAAFVSAQANVPEAGFLPVALAGLTICRRRRPY